MKNCKHGRTEDVIAVSIKRNTFQLRHKKDDYEYTINPLEWFSASSFHNFAIKDPILDWLRFKKHQGSSSEMSFCT